MEYVIKCYKHYADFEGRARRMEFWSFWVFSCFFTYLAIGIDRLLGSTGTIPYFGIISQVYATLTIIPQLAVSVRRLHDLGKKGYWLFIGFIPYLGLIWIIILNLTKGEAQANKYGDDPLAEEE